MRAVMAWVSGLARTSVYVTSRPGLIAQARPTCSVEAPAHHARRTGAVLSVEGIRMLSDGEILYLVIVRA